MEDILIFTDREVAMDHLKRNWKTRSLLEYGFNNGVGYGLKSIYYYVGETGKISECKYTVGPINDLD